MGIITGTGGSGGTDYTGQTGLTEIKISEAIVKADEYDPTKIPGLEGDVEDIQSDISSLQADVTSLENAVVRSSIVVPVGSWWNVAVVNLGEFSIQINSQQSNSQSNGLGVENLGSKRVYLTSEYSHAPSANSSVNAVTTSVTRTSPSPNDTIGVGAENASSSDSYTRYKLLFSSYGSSAPITDILQMDVTVTRYDSNNRLFIFRSELVNG